MIIIKNILAIYIHIILNIEMFKTDGEPGKDKLDLLAVSYGKFRFPTIPVRPLCINLISFDNK